MGGADDGRKIHSRSRELPRDRGWSWVICFASFLCMFLTGTSMQVLSVLFLELVNEYGSSVTVTSLTVMCFVLALSISSVVSTSVLIPAFGERLVVAVSGALFALCSIGYFLSPNIAVFIAFAAAKGTCVGMIFVPSVSLLSYYFDRRRSLATTISNSGICVASIVSPPVIRAVTTEYGMRGTFLLLAAVELHMVAAGLLMRPVSSYRAVPPKDSAKVPQDKAALIKDNPSTGDNPRSGGVEDSDAKQELLSSSTTQEENKKPAFSDLNNGQTSQLNGRYYDRVDSRVNDDHQQSEETSVILKTEDQFDEKPISPQDSRRESTRRKSSLGQNSSHGSSWSVSRRQHNQAAHHESMLSITSGLEPAVTGIGLQRTLDKEPKGSGWKQCCCIVIIRRIFDPYLFSQLSYKVFLASCVPSATTQYLLQYIPTISVIKGATKDQAATLLTIVGSVDLMSRMAVGVLADTNLLRATQIVAIAQICQGIICQFNPLFDNYEKMIAMVVLMGLFIGTRQSLIAMTHIEVVGMEKMSRCLSISAMVATLSAAGHSPMLSAVMEATGSYNMVLHYVGLVLIIGAVMMLLTPLLERIDARREAKRTALTASSSDPS